MVSVEAQHAGCRVVASNAGGLPETDCGGLMLVEPDNPAALAEGIAKAAKKGPLSHQERRRAANVFTIEESVEVLLDIIGKEAEQGAPSLIPGLPKIASVGASKALAASKDYLPTTSTRRANSNTTA